MQKYIGISGIRRPGNSVRIAVSREKPYRRLAIPFDKETHDRLSEIAAHDGEALCQTALQLIKSALGGKDGGNV